MPRPLLIIIGLFLMLILAVGFTFPKYKNLTLLQLKVKEKESELQLEKEYFSQLAETSEKLKKHEESLSKINSALSPDPRLPALFNFLQAAASQNGLVLKKIAPSPTNPLEEELLKEGWSPETRETGANLTVSGSYPSFKNFLFTLEKTSRMIETENISFLSPEEEGPIDFSLRIKVYSY
jgi:Tfp pilus assembly protein PilO